jgi:hypothetical protein
MTRLTLFFFIWCGEGVFFFSDFITSCPFFFYYYLLSSLNRSFFFYLFILFHPSTPIYLCFFFPSFFLSLSSFFISCLCLRVMSDVYHFLSVYKFENCMSCPRLIFLPLFRLFFFLWVLLRLD